MRGTIEVFYMRDTIENAVTNNWSDMDDRSTC